ncbi:MULTISPECIES: hypothetical protein [Streptomyces]|uniref:hypothetical protein n=1 Tax=Streptomyces TaxID=1883 RepID=UPI0004CACF00|nr:MULTISPECIES: hypothetical protein [Streptomyces]
MASQSQRLLKAQRNGAMILERRSYIPVRFEPRHPYDSRPWVVNAELGQFRLTGAECRAVYPDPDQTT